MSAVEVILGILFGYDPDIIRAVQQYEPPPFPSIEPEDTRKTYPVLIQGFRATPYPQREYLKRNNGGTFTAKDWQRLLDRDKQCLCCGATENLSMDHVVPLSKGGRHSFENAQVLCRSCNSSKRDKTIDYRR